MQHKATRKAKRCQTSQNGIERLRRRTTFRSSTNDNFAVNQHDNPMTETLLATKNPLDIKHQSTSFPKINMPRLSDPNRENDIEIAELQTKMVSLT